MRPRQYLGEAKEKEIIEFFNFGFACALKILRLELRKL